MHRWLGFALLGLLFCACGRGEKRMGQPCASADECRDGFCVGGAQGEAPECTRTCGSTDDCPRGWACSGVTQDNVLVCSEGAPTPFGIGARE